jgi:nucleotide-binding universal stress UspA family protein
MPTAGAAAEMGLQPVRGDPMIKTILVPATGSNTDDAVFMSALAVARAFDAHIDFLHVRVDAGTVAATMATDGSAAMITGLVDRMEQEADQREAKAKQLFQRFCAREGLPTDEPAPGQPGPSAQWVRQIGDEPYWVAGYGRVADLLVIGRPTGGEGASIDTIEAALLESGRPVLIPPAAPFAALPETIVIAWKAAPEAARAVTAAMPLLSTAKQILILTVAEELGVSDEAAARLATNLGRHGLQISARHLPPDASGAADTLLAAAANEGALVVMGAYGHSRLREWIFGGFTQHVLRGAEVPVLMMH